MGDAHQITCALKASQRPTPMSQQLTFAGSEFSSKHRKTRKEILISDGQPLAVVSTARSD